MALAQFQPAVRDWFAAAFEGPTDVQERAWPAIATGEHVLIPAPTGSGERLAALQADGREPQRIGLSATQNPLEEIGRFMVGPRRTCTIVDAAARKPLDLQIHVPVESMVEPEQSVPDAAIDPFDALTGTS